MWFLPEKSAYELSYLYKPLCKLELRDHGRQTASKLVQHVLIDMLIFCTLHSMESPLYLRRVVSTYCRHSRLVILPISQPAAPLFGYHLPGSHSKQCSQPGDQSPKALSWPERPVSQHLA